MAKKKDIIYLDKETFKEVEPPKSIDPTLIYLIWVYTKDKEDWVCEYRACNCPYTINAMLNTYEKALDKHAVGVFIFKSIAEVDSYRPPSYEIVKKANV
jgi:hypothetical protein